MARRKTSPDSPFTGRSESGRVSATDAARNFSDLINRVLYNSDVFVIERGGRAVCEVRPVYTSRRFTGADLFDVVRSLPAPGDAYLDHVDRILAQQGRAESVRWPRS